MQFKRMFASALDSTAVWDSYADALEYARNKDSRYVPYNGQIISVKAGENAGIYKLDIDTSLTEELDDGREHYKLEPIGGLAELKETFTLRDNEETIEKIWEFVAGLKVLQELNAEYIRAISLVVDKNNEILTEAFKTFIASRNYIQGGSGFGIYKSQNGSWNLDIDNVQIRGGLSVNSLQVSETEHLGGEVILTVGESIEATAVELADDGYKVSFKNKDDDGNEIFCKFAVNDLVKHQTYNKKNGQRYYWLEVKEVGDDYVMLSRLAGDTTSYSSPLAGDKIVHLGNTVDKDRQAALIFSARTQSMRIYTGIDTTSLGNAEAPIDLNPIESKILAKFITMSTGVSLDTAFTDIRDRMGVLVDDVDLLKSQTDKQFTIWFGDYTPTLKNKPYIDWVSEEKDERDLHIKDIYYNQNKDISQGGGRAYRFEKDVTGNYSWAEITDKDTLLALEKAAKAQDTADGKRRIFIEQPVPPYDEGDMWVNASYSGGGVSYDNDTLVVKKGCGRGENEYFNISDWQPASTATTAYLAQLADQILLFAKNTNDSISGIQDTITDIQGKIQAVQYTVDKEVGRATGLANIALTTADSTMSALQLTNDRITALVGGDYLNDDGTVKTSYHGIISATAASIAGLVEKLDFDENGLVKNIDKSGLVLTSTWAEMFTDSVDENGNIVSQAHIATLIADGVSKAVIKAEKVEIGGSVTINDYFKVDGSGYLTIGRLDANGDYDKAALTVYGNGEFSGIINASGGVFSNIRSKGYAVKDGNKEYYFELDQDGKLTANEVVIRGSINATSGTFNNITSNGGGFTIDAEGKITAIAGVVGGFTITSSSLKAGEENSGQMYLSANLMRFSDKGNGNNYVYIGSDVMPGSMGGSMSCPMRIEVNRTYDGIPCNNSGILIDVEGSKGFDDDAFYGNHALYIKHGDIIGLRPRVRRVSRSFTLDKDDFTILTVGSDTITITLPNSPEDAEMHLFRKLGCNYTLQVGDASHKIKKGNKDLTSWSISNEALVILIWDRVNKLWIGNYAE